MFDDLERLLFGIQTAYEVTAARLGKSVEELTYADLRDGPKIIYNGTKEQNKALLNTLFQRVPRHENNLLSPPEDIQEQYSALFKVTKPLIYPFPKFIINNLGEGNVHTKGQLGNRPFYTRPTS